MRSKVKKRVVTSLVVLLQIVVVLAALEVTVRILARSNQKVRTLTYSAAYTRDYTEKNTIEDLLATTAFGYHPYHAVAGFKLNSKGFRTREYAEEKRDGKYRICVLGDSFSFASGGTPYEKHWPVLLERTLRRTVSKKIDLINLGMMSVGPRFEFRLWQLEGSKLEADLVIVAFFIGNDFIDGSHLPAVGSSPTARLADRSYLARVVRNWLRLRGSQDEAAGTRQRIEQLTGRKFGKTTPGATVGERKAGVVDGYRYDGDVAKFSKTAYNRMVFNRMRQVLESNDEYFERLFVRSTDLLLEFEAAVSSSGAEFLLVMIPDEYQVDPEVMRRAVEFKSKYRSPRYDIDKPQRRLVEFCEANNVDYVDLLPAFRERAETTKLYKLRDTHWGLEGNAYAAELLAERFRAEYAKSVPQAGRTDGDKDL